MIEDTKIVKKIEAKAGGKSGTYWTVTWDNDKSDNIFNGEWVALLEQSQEEEIPLHFTKERVGNYYNIKTLEFLTSEAKSPQDNKIAPPIAPQEKGMWWKEAGECFRSGLFKKDDKAAGTYLWRAYVKQMLTSLEITIPSEIKAESKLIEEAKKL